MLEFSVPLMHRSVRTEVSDNPNQKLRGFELEAVLPRHWHTFIVEIMPQPNFNGRLYQGIATDVKGSIKPLPPLTVFGEYFLGLPLDGAADALRRLTRLTDYADGKGDNKFAWITRLKGSTPLPWINGESDLNRSAIAERWDQCTYEINVAVSRGQPRGRPECQVVPLAEGWRSDDEAWEACFAATLNQP